MFESPDSDDSEASTSADSREEDIRESKKGATPLMDDQCKGTKDAIAGTLDSVLARRAQKLKDLSAKREAKELSPYDFDLNYVFRLNEAGLPLTRTDMLHETGSQALILSREELDVLGFLCFIRVSGERMLIEPESLDPHDVFILYPHEVGDIAMPDIL